MACLSGLAELAAAAGRPGQAARLGRAVAMLRAASERTPGWSSKQAFEAGWSQPSARQRACVVTTREHEVAELVARGLTNRQIAADLSISPHTTATHVEHMLRKLGLRSRSELAAWFVDHAMDDPIARSNTNAPTLETR